MCHSAPLRRTHHRSAQNQANSTRSAALTMMTGSAARESEVRPSLAYNDDEYTVEVASRISCVTYETTFRKATIMSSFFNLANTIFGSGMLGLPYAFAASGWVLGSFLLIISGAFSAFALHTLSLCATKVGAPVSYYSVAVRALPSFTLAIDSAVAIMCFGVATSYLVVIGDLMPQVMHQMGASAAARNRHLWIFLGFASVAPLCGLRNLDSLKFTSSMSTCFVFFLTMLVILYSGHLPGLDPCEADDAPDDDGPCVGEHTNGKLTVHTLKVLSIFVFGFTCQHNMFSVTNELKMPTQPRLDLVIALAVGSALAVYLAVAGCGYATFGDQVKSNVLVSYPENYLTSIARLFVSLLVGFSYPLECHPFRRSMLSLLHHFDNYRHNIIDAPLESDSTASPMQAGVELGDLSPTPGTLPTVAAGVLQASSTAGLKSVVGGYQLTEFGQRRRFTLVTLCFLSLSLLIALAITDLGTVLAFVGATGSITVSYILPGFFYYIIFQDEGPAWKRNLALAQGVLGLMLMPLCLTFIFI